jgi:hypothetical protein
MLTNIVALQSKYITRQSIKCVYLLRILFKIVDTASCGCHNLGELGGESKENFEC